MLKSLDLYLILRLNGKVFFGTNFEIFHNFGPIGEKTTGMPKLIMKWNLIRPSSSIIPESFVFGQEDLAEKNEFQVTKKSSFLAKWFLRESRIPFKRMNSQVETF